MNLKHVKKKTIIQTRVTVNVKGMICTDVVNNKSQCVIRCFVDTGLTQGDV